MATPTQFEIDCALMSGVAYESNRQDKNKFPVPDGWGIMPGSYKTNPSGFEAVSFSQTNADGTKEIVISFAGTNKTDPNDWAADLNLALGEVDIQLLQAAEYYMYIKSLPENVGASITFTGHSLGGGLAALMAVLFNEDAVTFDQAPFKNAATESVRMAILNHLQGLPYKYDINDNPVYAPRLYPTIYTFDQIQNQEYDLLSFTNDSLASREDNISGYYVQGEKLTSDFPYDRAHVLDNPEPLDHGTTNIGGWDLHSLSLLTAFLLKPDFKEVTKKLPGLLDMIYDETLYAKPTSGRDENFLERLIRHQEGVVADSTRGVTAVAADDMLTRFTDDLLMIAKDGGLTMNENISKALTAFAMQMYYANPAAANPETYMTLFDEYGVTGGVHFKTSDVTTDPITTAKGFTMYFQNYLNTLPSTGEITPDALNSVKEKLPNLIDWYIQAGASPMTATAGSNSAFMLGGDGSDVLTGGSANDVLMGGKGNDQLNGGGGDDLIIGGSDKDIIDGGTGADTMYGGGGDDTYYVDSKNDVVVENAAAGTDTVISTVTYTLPDNVDNLTLAGTDSINGRGNALDNIITGNSAANIIFGGAGNDNIIGGDGNNKLFGEAGNDFIVGGNNDDYIDGGADNDTISGGAGNNKLFGDAGNDFIVGGKDNDIIFGGSGNDTIWGGGGNDKLYSGGGSDILYGGAGNDFYYVEADGNTNRIEDKEGTNILYIGNRIITDFCWNTGNARYESRDGQVVGAFSGTDFVVTYADTTVILNEDFEWGDFGIDLITPSTNLNPILGDQKPEDLNDILYGTSASDQIIGLTGVDLVYGGSGSDEIFVTNQGDMATLIAAGETAPDQGGTGELADGGSGDDFVYGSNASDLLCGGSGNDLLVGGGGDDVIYGDGTIWSGNATDYANWSYNITTNDIPDPRDSYTQYTVNYSVIPGVLFDASISGDDVIYAGAGNDFVCAGSGDDEVYGGAGDDIMWGEAGNDFIEGGDGNDILTGDSGPEYLNPDQNGNDYIDGGAGDDKIFGCGGNDELFGGDGADSIYGGSGDDYLDGEAGMDSLDGGAGNDVMFGGDGNDTLYGGDGDDYLDGEDGDDILSGGAGNDVIFGGAGNDSLYGDASNVALADQGDDYIDGEGGNNLIAGFGGNDTLYAADGNDTIFGNEGDDYIDAGDGNNTIYGGDGNNEIYAGDGDDYIVGGIAAGTGSNYVDAGDGNNTIFGGDGDNEIYAGSGNDYIVAYFQNGSGSNYVDAGDGNDSIWGGAGNDTINGGVGDDQIVAGKGNDEIYGGAGNDTLYGGEGDDYIEGGDGNDFLHGGPGNDTLIGGSGSDTYFFNLGDGSKTIDDIATDDEGNTVLFGEGITAADLKLMVGSLDILVGNNGDVIHFDNFDPNDAYGTHAIDSFEFADGTALTYSQLIDLGFEITGTSGDDQLSGTSADDRMMGLDGNDYIASGAGNDYIDGGPGNDTLYGGTNTDYDLLHDVEGANTYIFNRGSGLDVIEVRLTADHASGDTVVFGEGITPEDLSVQSCDEDYQRAVGISIGDNDGILITGVLSDGENLGVSDLAVRRFVFADGQELTLDQVLARADSGVVGEQHGTAGDDYLAGSVVDDYIYGEAGNDVIDGRGYGNIFFNKVKMFVDNRLAV